MKTILTVLIITLHCALLLPAKSSQKSPQCPPGELKHETRMLQHLLNMEQAELTKLRQTIERIEGMTDEEKALLSQRITKLKKMKPERVEAMRKRFEAIPEETRETMRQRWLEMAPEERRAWRKKLRAMPQEERIQILKENGFLPTPARKPKENKPMAPSEQE